MKSVTLMLVVAATASHSWWNSYYAPCHVRVDDDDRIWDPTVKTYPVDCSAMSFGDEIWCNNLAIRECSGLIYGPSAPPQYSVAQWESYTDVLYSVNNYSHFNPDQYYVDQISMSATGSAVFAHIQYVNTVDNRTYEAKVHVFPGTNNSNSLDKPVIVGDAFDPLSNRDVKDIANQERYSKLLATTSGSPRALGFDIFFIDFSQGGGDIFINAGLVTEFILWLRNQTSAKLIVGGPSMSGLIARVALLYTLPQNNTQAKDLGGSISGYLSMDTPHQGASISPDFQSTIYSLTQDLLAVSGSDSPLEGRTQMWTPAARQMLYGIHVPGYGTTSIGHDAFYGRIREMGDYRSDIPKVAIAYSDFHKTNGDYDPLVERDIVRINVEAIGINDAVNREASTGGNAGIGKHEWMPGSSGNWYFKVRDWSNPSYTYPLLTINDGNTFYSRDDHNDGVTVKQNRPTLDKSATMFTGTFIPIYSALDFPYDTYANGTMDSHLANAKASSRFNAVYIMESGNNGYANIQNWITNHSQYTRTYCNSVNVIPSLSDDLINAHRCWQGIAAEAADHKYEHMVFDDQLMDAISKSLLFLQTHPRGAGWISSVTNTLL